MDHYESARGPGAAAVEQELSDGDLEAVVGGLSRVILPGVRIQRPVYPETASEPFSP